MKLVGLAACAIVVAACSSTVEGTGKSVDEQNSLVGDDGNSTPGAPEGGAPGKAPPTVAGDSGAPPSGSACSLSTGNVACDGCVNQGCCAEIMACASDPDCTSLDGCIAQCVTGDQPCVDACVQQYPNGKAPLLRFLECADQRCKAQCG